MTIVRDWQELESKDAAKVIALFQQMGITAEVDRSTVGVAQLVLTSRGTSVRLAIGAYSSAISIFRLKPEVRKVWHLSGECRGLPVDEEFDSREKAEERRFELETMVRPEQASLQLKEEEVEETVQVGTAAKPAKAEVLEVAF